ncbi:MAG: LysM peptidoglycan-binding domain-containing protein [Akkermansiaceae bacterium]|nr:LysM peptidoglycan-binding domain-containing protein [Verrucomicrobiales bacterium]
MSTNPFTVSTSYLATQQQLRRERVKFTFYSVLGALIVFCLALLFQGCQHHEAASENPIKSREAAIAAPAKSMPASTAARPVVSEEKSPGVSALVPVQTRAVPAATAPVEMAVKAPVAQTLYVVKPGDSLSRIAKITGTTVVAIKAVNGLASERISAGKTLKIPNTNS